MAVRLTLWTDITMIGMLSTNYELELYRIAAALFMIGALLGYDVATIFNPSLIQKVADKAYA